jgi:hypothetical protein
MSRSKTYVKPRKDETPSEAAKAGLHAALATVWRWEYEKDPVFVTVATHLGQGRFAVASDSGTKNAWGHSFGPYSDLYVKLTGSNELLPVSFLYETPLKPIIILAIPDHLRGSLGTPEIAPMGSLAGHEYARVWRIGYCDGVFAEFDLENGPVVHGGDIFYEPDHTYFRGGADKLSDTHSIVVTCGFDYPGRKDYGAPVTDQDGRLAGVLVGGDTGPEQRHVGCYTPIDLIMPFVALGDVLASRKDRAFGLTHRVAHTRDEAGI